MSDVPAVVDTQLPTDLPKEFALEDVIAVARDLAMNIKTIEQVRDGHGLTEDQFEVLRQMPFFQRVYIDLVQEWGKITKTEDRIKFQALAGLEDGLPAVLAGMTNKHEALSSRIDAAKFAAKVGGLEGSNQVAGGSGEKFILNITLSPNETVRIEKDITPASAFESAAAISSVAEGSGDGT